MIYILVLFGSFFGLCLLLGGKVFLRSRALRRFVRGVNERTDSAVVRGVHVGEDISLDRPSKSPRITAMEAQQVYRIVRDAEKFIARGEANEAERLYIKALTIKPDAHQIQAELARLYLTTGRETKAEALYKEILLRCEDASYYANLGLAYYQQGKYKRACQAYQEALNRDPANPERSYALGRACIAAQRFQEAAPLLEKASQRLSRDVTLLHMLAECYMQLGQREQAEEAYRRINRLQPYDENVKAKISSLSQ